MSEPTPVRLALETAIGAQNWERVEELWLEALEETSGAGVELLDVPLKLAEGGNRGLARTLLDLLAETLEAAEDHRGALATLRELVRLADKRPAPELLGRLERAVLASRSGCPSLRAVLERYPLASSRRPLDDLEAIERWLDFEVGSVVEVSGQGVGRVTDLNLELENIRVEIPGGRPVSVPFGAVPRYLRRLEPGDFRHRKVVDPEGLRRFVASDPGAALVELLSSLGEPADASAIKGVLDGLLPPDQWTTWWGRARKHPRLLSAGTGSRLRYRVSDSAESATDALLAELRAASPRERLLVARRLAPRGDEAAAATAGFLATQLEELEGPEPGLAWEVAGLIRTLPGGAEAGESARRQLVETAPPLALLAGVQDRNARAEALVALREARPSSWIRLWADWLPTEEHAANLDLLASELDRAGAGEALQGALEKVFRDHLGHPAQVVWAWETMTSESCPEPLRRRMTPSVLEVLLDALSRPEFAALRSRSKTLLDGGRVAVRLILEQASPQQATRFENRLARLSGIEPQRLQLIQQAVRQRTAVPADATPVLVASRTAVEAKRAELRQLLEEEIPRTLKGINAAAAEGDLRENFEYHMLRDRQELLSARAAKIKRELATVRILEPGSADTSRVNIGTVIRLVAGDGSPLAPVTILGPWDAAVERRVFADGSDLAQRLLGSSVGDEVEVEGVFARITAIEPWTG